MCEYLGKTGYLTPTLHSQQWGAYLLENMIRHMINEHLIRLHDFGCNRIYEILIFTLLALGHDLFFRLVTVLKPESPSKFQFYFCSCLLLGHCNLGREKKKLKKSMVSTNTKTLTKPRLSILILFFF